MTIMIEYTFLDGHTHETYVSETLFESTLVALIRSGAVIMRCVAP
jgi:hypothetical protein